MRDWHGISYAAVQDAQTRDALAQVDDFLAQLSPAIGRLGRGETPNSSIGFIPSDHGLLTGLADNDHPQYLLAANFNDLGDARWQPLDATLTALAALDAVAGLVEQTGADAFTKRLIGVAGATSIPTRADADARYASIAEAFVTIGNTTGLSGERALAATAPITLTDGGAGAAATLALANTAVTPAAYGSATQVGTFTVDAQGRLTAAANVTISGAAPGAHTHDWADITGEPSTIGGYGITDFVSLGDAEWSQLGHTHTASEITNFVAAGDVEWAQLVHSHTDADIPDILTITRISNLTAGLVRSAADGTLSLDTSTYLTAAVTSVTGTTNRITSSGGATPAIDIAATYVGQTSITTLGTIAAGTWSATTIALDKGGTGKALTAANGGIVYSDADSMEILAATATAGQILRSGASAAPSWSTATYPATAGTTQNLLVSDGTNWASTAMSALTSASFLDSAFRIIGSVTATKLLAFEVDGLSVGTLTLTPQNLGSYIIAGTNIANTFTGIQTFDNHVDFESTTEANPIVVRKGGARWLHTFTNTTAVAEIGPDQNIFLGLNCGPSSAPGDASELDQVANVGIGSNIMESLTYGAYNVAIGTSALFNLTSGGSNLAIGGAALAGLTTGQSNVGIGANAGGALISGIGNLAIGSNSLLLSSSGASNVAIGDSALGNATGSNNIGIGYYAGKYSTGNSNVVIDSVDRVTTARQLREAIIVGTMSASLASQTLRFNAAVTISESINLVFADDDIVCVADEAVLYADT